MKEATKRNTVIEVIDGVKYTRCTKTFGPKVSERTFPPTKNSVFQQGRKSVTLGNNVTSL